MSDSASSNDEGAAAEKIEAVARILIEARMFREPLGPLPADLVPTDLTERR